jgi:hypothetical protein
MSTTTSKKATAKDATAKATAKPAKAKAKAAPAVEDEPKRGPIMVVIDGAGTMPLIDNNGRRVMRGEPVEVSPEEVAWLASNGCAFDRV